MGRKSKYVHLLRAMKPGDVVYLPATAPRFDRQLQGTAFIHRGRIEVCNMVAVMQHPPQAHHIVRVTMLKPFK